MNNSNNPFVPKGSLLELQGKRRSQFKIAVFCVIAVGVVSLSAMLIQGCERKKPTDDTNSFGTDTSLINTNLALSVDTNAPVTVPTNVVAYNPPPLATNTLPQTPPADLPQQPVATGASEYKIAKGDTLGIIAKKNGVTVKALQAANPKLDPKRLKIGATVQIPAATSKVSADAAGATATDGTTYVVKHGDTLGRIAKAHGTTVKAIKAANNLTTDAIKVGQHLKLPAKAESIPAPVAAPVETTTAPPAAPAFTPVTTPAPVAPGSTTPHNP